MEHFHFTKSFFIVGKVPLYLKKKNIYSHEKNTGSFKTCSPKGFFFFFFGKKTKNGSLLYGIAA